MNNPRRLKCRYFGGVKRFVANQRCQFCLWSARDLSHIPTFLIPQKSRFRNHHVLFPTSPRHGTSLFHSLPSCRRQPSPHTSHHRSRRRQPGQCRGSRGCSCLVGLHLLSRRRRVRLAAIEDQRPGPRERVCRASSGIQSLDGLDRRRGRRDGHGPPARRGLELGGRDHVREQKLRPRRELQPAGLPRCDRDGVPEAVAFGDGGVFLGPVGVVVQRGLQLRVLDAAELDQREQQQRAQRVRVHERRLGGHERAVWAEEWREERCECECGGAAGWEGEYGPTGGFGQDQLSHGG